MVHEDETNPCCFAISGAWAQLIQSQEMHGRGEIKPQLSSPRTGQGEPESIGEISEREELGKVIP